MQFLNCMRAWNRTGPRPDLEWIHIEHDVELEQTHPDPALTWARAKSQHTLTRPALTWTSYGSKLETDLARVRASDADLLSARS